MEGGGNKFVCAVGLGPDQIVDQIHFPTTTPDETLEQAIAYFVIVKVSEVHLHCAAEGIPSEE